MDLFAAILLGDLVGAMLLGAALAAVFFAVVQLIRWMNRGRDSNRR
jgi:hypothetical protein